MSSSRALIVIGATIVAVALAIGGSWAIIDRDDSDEAEAAGPPTQHFRSRPDLRPPPVTITRTGPVSPGYVFLAPKQDVVQAGPMIVDSAGNLVWFHPLDTHGVADFKVQRYGDRPVLTWWRGRADKGVGDGYYVIMNDSYREIAHVFAGDGLVGDIHEFLITPQDTALITVYHRIRRDLSEVGGPRQGSIYEGVVQEINIATGKVLFEWHSAGHIALDESYAKPPKASRGAGADPYDYFHLNSIAIEPNGNLLISARNTRTIYEINRQDGRIVWRLGGKKTDFTMGPGTRFAWQHDARRQPNGTITLFDNGADPRVEPRSRALMLRVDTTGRTATLIRRYTHPHSLSAPSQGNAQFLPDGHVFVGWGAKPYFTEYDRSGHVVLDGHFGTDADSYRIFRFPWHGYPTDQPTITATHTPAGTLSITASWNGATEVARWQLRVGTGPATLHPIKNKTRTGFEATFETNIDAPLVQVRALDRNGTILGSSRKLPIRPAA